MNNSNISSFIKTTLFEVNVGNESEKRSNIESSSENSVGLPRDPKCSKLRRPGQNGTTNLHDFPLQTKQSHCLATRNTSTSKLVSNTELILCSLFEVTNPLSTTVGCCIINFDTGELVISEIIDSQIFIRTLHRIQVFEPSIIIVPASSVTPHNSKLLTILKRNIHEGVKFKEIPTNKFSCKIGLEVVKEYTFEKEKLRTLQEELLEKEFALSAVAGAFWFLKKELGKDSNYGDSMLQYYRTRFENPEDTMLIDSNTIRGLELLENKNSPKGLSLFKCLDTTVTPMGRRLLRNSILQPLTSESCISSRLDAVFELVKKKQQLKRVTKELSGLGDLDKLFSKLLFPNTENINPEQRINYILILKKSLLTAQNISHIISEINPESSLLTEIKHIFANEDLNSILNLLNQDINEDCVWANTNLELQKQRCYAVKSGSNGLLKVSRELYHNIMEEILEEVRRLNDKYNFGVNYGYEGNRGFYLKIKKEEVEGIYHLPPVFINKKMKKKMVECSTLPLLKLNSRLRKCMDEVLLTSEDIISVLFAQIKNRNMSPLFMLAEAAAMLDLFCCFATNTVKYQYSRPVFTEVLNVKGGRHPILERLIPSFVSNDIVSIRDSSNFHIVTGCNGSGKSVYLRQIALLSIMVQMGCPAPASSSTFKLFKVLHARLCNDTMEVSTSNFAFEMKEIVYFLHNISSESLLIIDELGRGSSINEGLSITLAIVEYLLTIRNTVFLSTHYKELPQFFRNSLPVVHLNMKTEISDNRNLQMSYRHCMDAHNIDNYGIAIVTNILNLDIIRDAYRIAKLLLKSNIRIIEKHGYAGVQRAELLDEMKKINNIVSIISSFLTSNKKITSEDIKEVQNKIVANI